MNRPRSFKDTILAADGSTGQESGVTYIAMTGD